MAKADADHGDFGIEGTQPLHQRHNPRVGLIDAGRRTGDDNAFQTFILIGKFARQCLENLEGTPFAGQKLSEHVGIGAVGGIEPRGRDAGFRMAI